VLTFYYVRKGILMSLSKVS